MSRPKLIGKIWLPIMASTDYETEISSVASDESDNTIYTTLEH